MATGTWIDRGSEREVWVQGDLDHGGCDELLPSLDAALGSGPTILLRMEGVGSICSRGVTMLLSAYQRILRMTNSMSFVAIVGLRLLFAPCLVSRREDVTQPHATWRRLRSWPTRGAGPVYPFLQPRNTATAVRRRGRMCHPGGQGQPPQEARIAEGGVRKVLGTVWDACIGRRRARVLRPRQFRQIRHNRGVDQASASTSRPYHWTSHAERSIRCRDHDGIYGCHRGTGGPDPRGDLRQGFRHPGKGVSQDLRDPGRDASAGGRRGT